MTERRAGAKRGRRGPRTSDEPGRGPALRRAGWLALVVAALVVAGLQACQPSAGPGPRAAGRWEVVFHDGFDGSSLSDRWGTCFWWDEGDGCTIASNDEAQWYVPEQVAVRGGVLRLTAAEQPSEHDGKDYTHVSGMVSTGRPGDELDDVARHAFTFGSVEVRFRAPAGTGLWPAVWMLPVTNESRPEIDLLEQYGDELRQASMTLHTTRDGDEVRSRTTVATSDLSRGWHTVGIDWTDDHVIWFLDGREVFRVEGDDVPREPMYLVLNLAVGGPAGTPDPSAFPATFLVDEVTVWRQR